MGALLLLYIINVAATFGKKKKKGKTSLKNETPQDTSNQLPT